MATKAYVALSGSSVYINSETAGGRFTLQEGDLCMCFGVFHGYAEVEDVRVEHEPFFRYFEVFYFIVFLGVKDVLAVGSQPFAKVDIIGIASEALTGIRIDLNGSFFYFFLNTAI